MANSFAFSANEPRRRQLTTWKSAVPWSNEFQDGSSDILQDPFTEMETDDVCQLGRNGSSRPRGLESLQRYFPPTPEEGHFLSQETQITLEDMNEGYADESRNLGKKAERLRAFGLTSPSNKLNLPSTPHPKIITHNTQSETEPSFAFEEIPQPKGAISKPEIQGKSETPDVDMTSLFSFAESDNCESHVTQALDKVKYSNSGPKDNVNLDSMISDLSHTKSKRSTNRRPPPNYKSQLQRPFTIEEHRLFLLRLKEFGANWWTEFARNWPTRSVRECEQFYNDLINYQHITDINFSRQPSGIFKFREKYRDRERCRRYGFMVRYDRFKIFTKKEFYHEKSR